MYSLFHVCNPNGQRGFHFQSNETVVVLGAAAVGEALDAYERGHGGHARLKS